MPLNNIYVPLITPLSDTASVCQKSVHEIITYCKNYVTGFIPCLTSGEGWKLEESEWTQMCQYTRNAAPDHRVIAGIEKPTTDEVVFYVKLAENMGLNGVMITSPFGNQITQDTIINHYRQVHDCTNIDVYIYNESELSNNITSNECSGQLFSYHPVGGFYHLNAFSTSAGVA